MSSTRPPPAHAAHAAPPALAALAPVADRASIADITSQYDRVALVLQGGGALGAYQVGVYQALAEAGCEPSWISGVSIGAINAALIAGNPPDKRLERLDAFWSLMGNRPGVSPWSTGPDGDWLREWSNLGSAWTTALFGQPGFFKPRLVSPWLLPPGSAGATSYYDSGELHDTLASLVDFHLLNDCDKRVSVGAVNVATGNNVFFDTHKQTIGPEHIVASGALPPALPMVKIEGQSYWDGGIVSNTPLQYLLDQDEDLSSLVFQVDLFSARGPIPRRMSDVATRQKDITYSSRTRQSTDGFRRTLALRAKLLDALQRVPQEQLRPGEAELIDDYSRVGVVNILHLIFQAKTYESDAKDFEFSARSMRDHRQAGYDDTVRTLRHREWLQPPPPKQGIKVHDVHRDDPT